MVAERRTLKLVPGGGAPMYPPADAARELRELIAAWQQLSADARARVLAIVRREILKQEGPPP